MKFLTLQRKFGLALILSVVGTGGSYAHEHKIKPLSFDINFAQTYNPTACPASAPAGAFCLDVNGVLDVDTKNLGQASFQRIATIPSPSQFDPAHPTCIHIETTGNLTLPKGTLNFMAPGNVCLAKGIAAYDLIFTGGTGAYAESIGGGKIFVTPPDSRSTGRELWHFELYNNSNRN